MSSSQVRVQLLVPLGVGREQAPRGSGSGFAKIVAGTASARLLVTGLHVIELPRNVRNGHLASRPSLTKVVAHLFRKRVAVTA